MYEIDFDKIREEITNGYIKVQKHPSADLFIYNYGIKTQIDWRWNPETMVCRGLIADGNDKIISRPFVKFFGEGQIEFPPELWKAPFSVSAKMDGSLGILYPIDGKWAIATRGSFVSEQAVRATEILHEKYPDYVPPIGKTALVEIVYPENRIVCDYGDMADLFFLALIDTESGARFGADPFNDAYLAGWTGPAAHAYYSKSRPETVLADLGVADDGTEEGLVLCFDYPSPQFPTRVKVKTDEYKRLHKLLTGINERHIWDELRAGRGMDAILGRVPDEYLAWATKVESSILAHYAVIEDECSFELSKMPPDLPSRKEAALYITGCRYPAVMFNMMDKKPYADIIWKLVKPQSVRTFRRDIDA